MMTLRMALVAAGLAAVVCTSCDRAKRDEGTGSRGGQTTTTGAGIATSDVIGTADNASKIKRPSDEVRMDPHGSRLVSKTTVVRTAPFGSDEVVELKSGTDVSEVAQARDYFLVLFSDPSSAGKKMAGWVYKDSLEDRVGKESTEEHVANAPNVPSSPSSGTSCADDAVRVRTDHEMCVTTCQSDSDCKRAGGVCDGNGRAVGVAGKTDTRYCVK